MTGSALFSSLTLRGVTLPNRCMISPMHRARSARAPAG